MRNLVNIQSFLINVEKTYKESCITFSNLRFKMKIFYVGISNSK